MEVERAPRPACLHRHCTLGCYLQPRCTLPVHTRAPALLALPRPPEPLHPARLPCCEIHWGQALDLAGSAAFPAGHASPCPHAAQPPHKGAVPHRGTPPTPLRTPPRAPRRCLRPKPPHLLLRLVGKVKKKNINDYYEELKRNCKCYFSCRWMIAGWMIDSWMDGSLSLQAVTPFQSLPPERCCHLVSAQKGFYWLTGGCTRTGY